MIAFIKDIKTFATIASENVSDYTLPGICTIKNTGKKTYTNCWLIVDGRIYYITQSTPKNDYLILTAKDPIEAFTRPVKKPNAGTYGAILKEILTLEFRDGGGDSYYAMPYIKISVSDSTSAAVETDDYGYMIPRNAMNAARNNGVVVDFKLAEKSTKIAITVKTASFTTANIILGDGHNVLKMESYSSGAVAKATIVTQQGKTDYYLSKSHTMSTTPPSKRADGVWNVYTAMDDEDLQAVARGAFSGNGEQHKIEFTSDRALELGQPVKIRTESGVYETNVTEIVNAMTSDRPLYRCGSLAVTLTDKVSSNARSATSGSGGRINPYPIGAVYMSVDSTSPETLFGGTWTQIQNRFLVAAGSEFEVKKTGGSKTHSHGLSSGYAAIYVNETQVFGRMKANINYLQNRYFKHGGTDYDTTEKSYTRGAELGGSTDAAESLPPYMAVYMWYRTA